MTGVLNLIDVFENLKQIHLGEFLLSEPLDFDPQNERYKIKSVALVLQLHAEIEYYIEESILFQINEKLDQYRASNYKIVPAVLARLNAETIRINREDKSGGQKKTLSLQNSVFHSREVFSNQVVKANNGIKKDNLRSILAPFYLVDADVEKYAAHIELLSNFGHKRGKYAHTSCLLQSIEAPSSLISECLEVIQAAEQICLFIKDN